MTMPNTAKSFVKAALRLHQALHARDDATHEFVSVVRNLRGEVSQESGERYSRADSECTKAEAAFFSADPRDAALLVEG